MYTFALHQMPPGSILTRIAQLDRDVEVLFPWHQFFDRKEEGRLQYASVYGTRVDYL